MVSRASHPRARVGLPRARPVLILLLQAGLAFLWAAPLLWMVSSVLLGTSPDRVSPARVLDRLPTVTLGGFQLLAVNFPIFRWYFNSLIVAASTTLLVLASGSLAGYAFARIHFRGREPLFVVLIAALLVPPEIIYIPLFLGFARAGLADTHVALILPQVANALTLFLFRQFFEQLPPDLEDAARIDGASRFGVYWRIVLPLSAPVLIAVAILTFMASWNDFMWPLIVANSDYSKTLPVGMNQYPSLAGATMVAVPAVCLFLLLSRYFMRGVSFSGIKG